MIKILIFAMKYNLVFNIRYWNWIHKLNPSLARTAVIASYSAKVITCNYYNKFKYILSALIEKRTKENEISVNYHWILCILCEATARGRRGSDKGLWNQCERKSNSGEA